MHIKLSRRTLRWVGIGLGAVIILIAFYVLGDDLTLRNAAGRPLIYSPSVRSAERYRRHCLRWLDELATMDARIEGLLQSDEITDPASLYDLSQEAERLVKEASSLAQDAAFTPAPPRPGRAETSGPGGDRGLRRGRPGRRDLGGHPGGGAVTLYSRQVGDST